MAFWGTSFGGGGGDIFSKIAAGAGPRVTSMRQPTPGTPGGPPTEEQMGQIRGGLGSLIESYNQAYQQARSANEARYQQMLGIAGQTTQQRAADIRSSYGQQQANMMQGLQRTGMAGTTVAPTMQMGIQREQQASLNRLADQMQQTRLGIMERRTDAYPEQGGLMQAIQAIGGGIGGGQGLGMMSELLGRVRQG